MRAHLVAVKVYFQTSVSLIINIAAFAQIVSCLSNKEMEESDKESKESLLNTMETGTLDEDEEQRETVWEDSKDDLFNAMT